MSVFGVFLARIQYKRKKIRTRKLQCYSVVLQCCSISRSAKTLFRSMFHFSSSWKNKKNPKLRAGKFSVLYQAVHSYNIALTQPAHNVSIGPYGEVQRTFFGTSSGCPWDIIFPTGEMDQSGYLLYLKKSCQEIWS